MATYEFWYNEVETFKGYFEAESREEAIELLGEISKGLRDITDLEGWESRSKDYQLEIDFDTVQSIN